MRRLSVVLALILATLASGCSAEGCPTALLNGVLTEQGGELVLDSGDRQAHRVIWPDGHAVRADGDTLVVTTFAGATVAREGDTVRLDGGADPVRDAFRVCGPFEVVPPVAS